MCVYICSVTFESCDVLLAKKYNYSTEFWCIWVSEAFCTPSTYISPHLCLNLFVFHGVLLVGPRSFEGQIEKLIFLPPLRILSCHASVQIEKYLNAFSLLLVSVLLRFPLRCCEDLADYCCFFQHKTKQNPGFLIWSMWATFPPPRLFQYHSSKD